MIVHLLHHVVDNIGECGPPWVHAMWAFQRLWGVLIGQNQSKVPATLCLTAHLSCLTSCSAADLLKKVLANHNLQPALAIVADGVRFIWLQEGVIYIGQDEVRV